MVTVLPLAVLSAVGVPELQAVITVIVNIAVRKAVSKNLSRFIVRGFRVLRREK
jgi:hypothetical protein